MGGGYHAHEQVDCGCGSEISWYPAASTPQSVPISAKPSDPQNPDTPAPDPHTNDGDPTLLPAMSHGPAMIVLLVVPSVSTSAQ